MIPRLRSETLVFATTSQPRSARTRSAPWAGSNWLTPTSIRSRSGASPREGIFTWSMMRSEETRGLFDSSCARTRPTPPSPTTATFTRTASGWGWICLSGQYSPVSFFPIRPFAVRPAVSLGRRTPRVLRDRGPKAYLRSRDGVLQGREGFGARGEIQILRRGRGRTCVVHASPLSESRGRRGGGHRRARTRGALRSRDRLPTARAAAPLGDRSRCRRLQQGAGRSAGRPDAERLEGRTMVRLLAGLVQDGLPELHGGEGLQRERPARHVHEQRGALRMDHARREEVRRHLSDEPYC